MPPWTTARASPSSALGPDEGLAREGYARHGAELYRTALARLGDDASAQDAVQETIVRAWRSAHRYDPDQGSLRTWLFAILRNVLHDHGAARGRRPTPSGPLASGETLTTTERPAPLEAMHVPDHSHRVVDSDLVARALATASEDHRTAIVETYLRGRPYDEVAAELGVPVSTLRSRVFHGLRHLRTTITTMEAER